MPMFRKSRSQSRHWTCYRGGRSAVRYIREISRFILDTKIDHAPAGVHPTNATSLLSRTSGLYFLQINPKTSRGVAESPDGR